MGKFSFFLMSLMAYHSSFAFTQYKRAVVIGSSTAAGLGASPLDSSWVSRFNHYYKYQLGTVDTTYNLAVSGTTCYQGMPDSYVPPAGRPVPDPAHNVSRAAALLSTLAAPADGVTIVNYPTNGYDGYSIPEIMGSLQL